ncbi:MAG: hypothetical protein OHK0011_10050 [Turneriella sp.]
MMKKTSIYLPESLVVHWHRERGRLEKHCAVLLKTAAEFPPTRLRLRRHQSESEECHVISVYWPLTLYNQLHAFASASRVSVSLLVSYLLRKLLNERSEQPTVLDYDFAVLEWSSERRAVREELRFTTIPPPLTP